MNHYLVVSPQYWAKQDICTSREYVGKKKQKPSAKQEI